MVEVDGSPGKRARKRYRRIQRRTPSGRTVTHYVERKPKASRCGRCHKELRGVPRERPVDIRGLPKNQRSVSRKFGGMLCHKCLVSLEKYRSRLESGFPMKRDLTIEKFLPRGWYNSLEKKFDKELKYEVEEIVSKDYRKEKAAKEEEEKGIEGLKGLGPKSLEKLKKAKIKTLSDLASANTKDLAKKTKIPEAKIKKWQEEAEG